MQLQVCCIDGLNPQSKSASRPAGHLSLNIAAYVLSAQLWAKIVDMSPPSVTERVRRLTDSGVISGFTIELDLKKLGYSLQAIVRAKPLRGQLHLVERILQDMPECTQCSKVTGEDCFIAHICLRSIDVLEDLLSPLKDRAETNTSIIHATPIQRRAPPILI